MNITPPSGLATKIFRPMSRCAQANGEAEISFRGYSSEKVDSCGGASGGSEFVLSDIDMIASEFDTIL